MGIVVFSGVLGEAVESVLVNVGGVDWGGEGEGSGVGVEGF